MIYNFKYISYSLHLFTSAKQTVKKCNKKINIDEVIEFAIMTHNNRIAVESALMHIFAIQYCLGESNREDFEWDDFLNYISKLIKYLVYGILCVNSV